jgi:hypothetical protein
MEVLREVYGGVAEKIRGNLWGAIFRLGDQGKRPAATKGAHEKPEFEYDIVPWRRFRDFAGYCGVIIGQHEDSEVVALNEAQEVVQVILPKLEQVFVPQIGLEMLREFGFDSTSKGQSLRG